MATRTARRKNAKARLYCALRGQSAPDLAPDLAPGRARAIRLIRAKWVSGTVLHFHFVEGPEAQREAVRAAFAEWKGLGIGLEFPEVDDPSDAEVRIGFDQGDGSWSYIGRDILGIATQERTMNFGWDLTDAYGRTTALHEIGHTLGMPHEHQNPFAGIDWDEQAVYATFSKPPNSWDRATIFHNILRQLDASEVEGSVWDPDSVMEYEFPAGVIREPGQYRDGLEPAGGLSDEDTEWVRRWYPPLGAEEPPVLEPFASRPISVAAGEQRDFTVRPPQTRDYEIATFGAADTVVVLFEEVDGELRFRAGDDDSGEERNAHLRLKLFKDRRYVLRLRLYYAWRSGDTAVMYW